MYQQGSQASTAIQSNASTTVPQPGKYELPSLPPRNDHDQQVKDAIEHVLMDEVLENMRAAARLVINEECIQKASPVFLLFLRRFFEYKGYDPESCYHVKGLVRSGLSCNSSSEGQNCYFRHFHR